VSHDHIHYPSSARLRWVLLMTAVLMIVEVVGGVLSNSLALLSDAGHMLSDVTALALAWFAIAQMRRPPDDRRSYGYHRLEVVSALMNGVILCAVAVLVWVSAYRRLYEPPEIKSGLMLVVAAIGLLVNLAGIALLHRDSRHSIGIRGAFLHVVGDTLGSVGAIGAAFVIRMTGWTRIDAVVSIAIGILIVVSGVHLIRESLHILLEGVPRHIQLPEVERELRDMDGIAGLHDLHVWRIGSNFDTLTVHLVVVDIGAGNQRKDAAREMLRGKFGIEHCTIEVEGPGEHVGIDCTRPNRRGEHV
jgi:cobalt-zinc-cadmium efflux system protein